MHECASVCSSTRQKTSIGEDKVDKEMIRAKRERMEGMRKRQRLKESRKKKKKKKTTHEHERRKTSTTSFSLFCSFLFSLCLFFPIISAKKKKTEERVSRGSESE